jgi:ADP-L-glycero-D-manno-heptose 6-epimerase
MKKTIIVTGGAGFIGSAIVWFLNKKGFENIIVVDSFGNSDKWKNLVKLKFVDYIEKEDFLTNLLNGKYNSLDIDTIFHMGACSSTINPDRKYYVKNNFEYSKEVAKFAISKKVRFIYASSGATYGDGSLGFSDDEEMLEKLRPLNMYGYSKHMFDLWLKYNGLLDKVVGLKYYNVFGPNEYHKGEMRSFIIKAYEQILPTKKVKLFKSHRTDYKDGEQLRDFIYIKDAVDITMYFFEHRDINGIFNVGTGETHSFNELVLSVFSALNIKPEIEYIDMPANIINQYQYYTKAEIKKLHSVGYKKEPTKFSEAVKEYVLKYIRENKFLADYES